MNRVQTIAESQFQTLEKWSRAFYLDPDLRGNKVTEITLLFHYSEKIIVIELSE